MSDARASVHAMFTLDEVTETELDQRLDVLVVEALIKAGVQYVDCPVCGAAQGVGDPCAMCAYKARMAAELAARGMAAPAEAAPEFFQPGHTYAREHHGRTIEFLVRSIDTAPGSSYRVARGWRLNEDGDWEPTDSDDLTGWTDTTTGEPA